ncbi:MAG: hypothetical protein HP496_06670 [Nitrospira sp.]|nr:hypothetical protein [Nitrospira sp.]
MAPRFNKEPINLIHRIPSQKQIDEARPVARPYGQILLNAGALCWRKVVDLVAYVTRYEDEAHPRFRKPLALPDRTMERTMIQDGPVRSNGAGAGEPIQEAETPVAAKVTILPHPSQSPSLVQSEEVTELRACMIRQQDEMARLTSHIQELTSLVTSQQQVLVHLGKELEVGTFSPVSTGTAASSLKRSRIVRKKPAVSETISSSQEHKHPFSPQESEGQSLHL